MYSGHLKEASPLGKRHCEISFVNGINQRNMPWPGSEREGEGRERGRGRERDGKGEGEGGRRSVEANDDFQRQFSPLCNFSKVV